MDKSQFQMFSLFIVSDNKTTISNYNRKQTAILMYQERRRHPPYTPYFIGNSSRVSFNTTDLKGN